MKKAVFYFLSTTIVKMRDLYACRLAEKSYQNKFKTYIHVDSPIEAQTLDTQLWTFRDISFVPHKIFSPNNISSDDVATNNIITTFLPSTLIGCESPPTTHHDVLINLTSTVPDFCVNFPHIIEIVPCDANLQLIAQKHMQKYKQLDYSIVTHEITS